MTVSKLGALLVLSFFALLPVGVLIWFAASVFLVQSRGCAPVGREVARVAWLDGRCVIHCEAVDEPLSPRARVVAIARMPGSTYTNGYFGHRSEQRQFLELDWLEDSADPAVLEPRIRARVASVAHLLQGSPDGAAIAAGRSSVRTAHHIGAWVGESVLAAVVLAGAGLIGRALFEMLRGAMRLDPVVAGICPNCRYDLTGLTGIVCPECGYHAGLPGCFTASPEQRQ